MKTPPTKRKCDAPARRLFVTLLCVFLSVFARDAKAADWLQYGFDPGKTGVNPDETILTKSSAAGLHQIFSHTTAGTMDGAPVALSGVTTPSGVKDLVFYSTTGGTLVAFDGRTGATVWTKSAGGGFTNSSPAIDPNRQFVYHYGGDGFIHKYAVGTGAEIMDPGFPQRALSQKSTNSLAALAIATARDGSVYLYAGGNSFDPARAGHMTVINLRDGSQHVFNFVCSNLDQHIGTGGCAQKGAGIWSRGGAAYDSRVDRVYATTAEFGSFNPGAHSWAESVVAFNPNGTGSGGNPVDSFTLSNFQQLINADQDLGSNHATVIPTIPGCRYPHMLVQVGKDFTKMSVNILNADDLTGHGHAGGTDGYLIRQGLSLGGDTFSGVAAWYDPSNQGVWLTIPSANGVAGALLTADASGLPKLTEKWVRRSGWSTSTVVANGVLYYANGGSAPGTPSGPGPGPTVYAVDITTGNEIWSAGISGHHWTSPIVVNGTLYMPLPTKIIAYSVAVPPGPPPTPTGLAAVPGNSQVTLSWNSSTNASGYLLKRDGVVITATPISGTSFTDVGLTNGVTYTYTVAATNSAGTSAYSGPVTATPVQGTSTPTATATASATPTPTLGPGGVKINSGGGAASPFLADMDFVGGTAATNWTGAIDTSAVTGAAPQAVYQAERYGASTYTIPLAAGSAQTVRLHFCENFFTAAGKRVFNVSINGSAVLTGFDIFAATGAIHKATVREFSVAPNASGQVVIQLANVTNNALINGIEVFLPIPTPTPTATATPTPTPTTMVTATATSMATPTLTPTLPPHTKINSGGGAVSPFAADMDFVGGTAATNWTGAIDTSAVTSPAPPAVYQTERYGASTYTIPGFAGGSSHTLRLHMCENFFTATGKRKFNVSINGTAVLTNFDIFATTGAAHKATIQEFTAVANASGQFVIQLANVTNNALINGIEIN